MSARRIAVIRLAIYTLVALVSIASSIVVARFIPPSGYGFYRFLRSGVPMATSLLPLLAAWAARYYAEGVEGAIASYARLAVAAAPMGAVAGAAAALLYTTQPMVVALSALVLAVYSSAQCLYQLAQLVRPARGPLAVLAARLTYATLVILLVYAARVGLPGALVAWAAASTVMLAYSTTVLRPLMVGRCVGCIREWLRAAYVQLLQYANGLVSAVEVPVALAAGASWSFIAGFYASTRLPLLLQEIVVSSIGFLGVYSLARSDPMESVRGAGVVAVAAAAMLGVAVAAPAHVVALLNTTYEWASPGVVAAATVLPVVVALNGLGHAYAASFRGRASVAPELAKPPLARLLASPLHLALVVLASKLGGGAGVALWVASSAAWSLVPVAYASTRLPRSVVRSALSYTARALLVLAASSAVAALLAPRGAPPTRFLACLESLLPSAVGGVAAGAAVAVLVEPSLRALLSRLRRAV